MKKNKKAFAAILATTFLATASSAPSFAYSVYARTWVNNSVIKTPSLVPGTVVPILESALTFAGPKWGAVSNTCLWTGTYNTTSASMFLASSFKFGQRDIFLEFGERAPGVTYRDPWAHTAEIIMNKRWYFSTSFDLDRVTNYTLGQADAQTVVLHELGHAHGLEHPDINAWFNTQPDEADTAVMTPSFVVRRALNSDDANGIRHLYPNC